jgi:hypothetical protein
VGLSSDCNRVISTGPRFSLWLFRNIIPFYGEELLHRLTPKLEDHPLLTVCECLFIIFIATPHIGGRSSVYNLRTRYVAVTRTHISQDRKVMRINTTLLTLVHIQIMAYVFNIKSSIFVFSFNIRDRESHLHKTWRKAMVFYILYFNLYNNLT